MDELGTRMRVVREAAGLTYAQMAARANFSRGYLCNVENGRRKPPPEMVLAYERVADEMDRRSLLTGAAAAAVAPAAVAELISRGFSAALHKRGSVEEWLDRAEDYGSLYMQLGASDLQAKLSGDLVVLQQSLEHPQLWATAARLMTVYGKTLPSNDGCGGAVKWYRLAAQVADRSEDESARVWVRGRAALALAYEGAALKVAQGLAEQALAISDKDSSGRLNALTAQAHVWGHRGMRDKALAALRDAERVAETSLSEELISDFAVPEWRWWTFASMLLSRLGDPAAVTAQDQADRTRPPTLPRFATHIELHRALMMTKQGDVESGVEFGRQAMESLPAGKRSLSLRLMFHEIRQAGVVRFS